MSDPEVEYYINSIGRSVFIAQLVSLDQNLGRLFNKLKEANLYDDSTIVFTTDNGANVATYGTSKSTENKFQNLIFFDSETIIIYL